jgi:hypothetical protein
LENECPDLLKEEYLTYARNLGAKEKEEEALFFGWTNDNDNS